MFALFCFFKYIFLSLLIHALCPHFSVSFCLSHVLSTPLFFHKHTINKNQANFSVMQSLFNCRVASLTTNIRFVGGLLLITFLNLFSLNFILFFLLCSFPHVTKCKNREEFARTSHPILKKIILFYIMICFLLLLVSVLFIHNPLKKQK